MQLSSYSSIYGLGHKAVADLTTVPCLVEEKVDGSQLSFARIDGELLIRSKGAPIWPEAPPKMFAAGVDVIKTLDLHDGWIYRGEYLRAPKHNTLVYSRTPHNYIALFDISTGLEDYLSYHEKAREAERLGLECVPLLFSGMVRLDTLKECLTRTSFLGGPLVEGVVIKPEQYNLYGPDKKVLMGKFVSEVFKETHRREWNTSPSKDVVMLIARDVSTPARWEKAIQSLREADQLTDSAKDIGPLIKAVHDDIEKEEQDYIKDRLYVHFRKDILRSALHGLPQWYKERLTKAQFEVEEHLEVSPL